MNTTQIVAIVLAAVIIIGGGAYFAMQPGSASPMGEPQGKLSAEQGGYTGSFFDLATRGGNYKCEVATSGTNNVSSGTVYVSGTDLRGDFDTTANGATIKSHMLKKGDDIYVWSDAMAQGVQMKATAAMQGGNTEASGQGVDGNQSYDWNCSATGVEASTFVVPASVKFMDIGAMMEGGAGFQIPAY